MRRKLRILVYTAVGVLLVVAGIGAWIIWALDSVPEFYQRALAKDKESQRQDNDACLQQFTSLASDLRRAREWQATFTADQVNAWLAVDLPENHADALPNEVREPRVAFQPHDAAIAWQYEHDGFKIVFSLYFDVYAAGAGQIAVQFKRARAGAVPMPLARVLKEVAKAAARADVVVEWRQAHGDPVALITLPEIEDAPDRIIRLETVELGEGELFLAGRTEHKDDARSAAR